MRFLFLRRSSRNELGACVSLQRGGVEVVVDCRGRFYNRSSKSEQEKLISEEEVFRIKSSKENLENENSIGSREKSQLMF